MAGKLIADTGRVSNRQHTTPCSDCPMRRDSVPAWLGGNTPELYQRLAHSDEIVHCHVISNQQCAGMAIYRANVCKRVDPPGLKLPADKVLVLGLGEFLPHHTKVRK